MTAKRFDQIAAICVRFALALCLPLLATAPPASAQAPARGASSPLSPTPMTFRTASTGGNCNGCEWIAAEGNITVDTPAAFRRFMDGRDYSLNVSLHSPGGDPLAAVELGREFRARRMTTSIGRTVPDNFGSQRTFAGGCYSACAIAFLGGVSRSYSPDPVRPEGRNQLGFHQVSFARQPAAAAAMSRMEGIGYGMSAGQVISGLLVAYAVGMGVDPRVVTLAGRVAPDEMWVLNAAEAEALKVTTRTLDTPDWRLAVVRGGLALAGPGTSYPDVPYQVGIACARVRPGWLQLDISIAVPSNVLGPTDGPLLSQSIKAIGTPVGSGQEAQTQLPMLPIRVAVGRVRASILLPPSAVSSLRSVGLSVGYDAPRVHLTILPWIRLAGRPVSEAVDLLLRNCPA